MKRIHPITLIKFNYPECSSDDLSFTELVELLNLSSQEELAATLEEIPRESDFDLPPRAEQHDLRWRHEELMYSLSTGFSRN